MFAINVGYVARLCANFGVRNLILVSPKFELDEAIRFSTAGSRYVENSVAYALLSTAIREEEPNVVVATTSITARRPANILRAAIDPRRLASHISLLSQHVMLVFGRDTTGLTNEEIGLCDLTVSISTGTSYRTLNISHAASIILYELYNEYRRGGIMRSVDRDLTDRLLNQVDKLAHGISFKKHQIPLLIRSLRHLLTRAQPERRELTLLLGFINKARLLLEMRAESNP